VLLDQDRASDLFAQPDRAVLAETLMAVPIYGGDQYSEYMRQRVRTYEFRNWFYLPHDSQTGFEEGFARLDHVQSIRMPDLRRHSGLALSEEALIALREWLIFFLTGRIADDSLILEYRSEEMARLKEERET
jgi:hypothetical protein